MLWAWLVSGCLKPMWRMPVYRQTVYGTAPQNRLQAA